MGDIVDELLGYIEETPVFIKNEPRRLVGRDFDVYRFLDGDEPKYFYSTRGTRLRVKKGGEKVELNLDHVRRIHID